MRANDNAVAGFFEDIPVLLVVLAGVMVLTVSGAIAAARAQDIENQETLDALARRLLDSLTVGITSDPTIEHVSVAAVLSVNVSRCAADVLADESFAVTFNLRYPHVEWLRTNSNIDGTHCSASGYASKLINVRLDDGTTGVLEVVSVVCT